MKFAEYLMAMEVENSYLSGGGCAPKLAPILAQAMRALNTRGECALAEGPTATHLKVVDVRGDPVRVADHQVPVLVRPLPERAWDLTTHAVAPHINGFNHVLRIATLADVENNLVKACVRNLLYYGAIALVPLFQYGNVYCTTPRLRALVQDARLRDRCLRYVAKSDRQRPSLRDVFRMYAAMTRGTTIRDLCLRMNPSALWINERKLVQFGVLEGLVRRVHKYPVLLGEPASLRRSLDGGACLDEICCSTGVSGQQLEDQLERDHNVVLLWR